jgi:hypothetical protein
MSAEYVENRLDIQRPPRYASYVQIAGGIIIVLIAVLGVFSNYETIIDLYERISAVWGTSGGFNEMISSAYVVASLIFIIVFLFAIARAVIGGLSNFFQGISELVRPWMPANVPGGYKDYDDVYIGFKNRTLSIYTTLDSFISGVFGENSMFLTPVQREVVEENSKNLQGRLAKVIAAIVLLVLSIWLVDWFTTKEAGSFLLDAGLGEFYFLAINSARTPLRTPFILFLVLQIVLAALEYALTMSLIPKRQPSASSHEGSEHYRGFGHPSQLFTRLPDLAHPLQWEDFANRAHTAWNELPSPAVGDTGSFNGYILIEQQPQPIEALRKKAAYFLQGAGWILTLIGYYIYLFQLLPSQLSDIGGGITETFVYAPIFVLAMSLVALVTSNAGRRFTQQARDLFCASWFQSNAILIECVGNLSRADIRVGKSVADSIESSNVVVRSDFTARFWAAQLISEAKRLDADRDLLALEQTDESRNWIEAFRQKINHLREEGIKPIGVDLEAREIDDLVKANLSLSGMRAAAIEQAKIQAAIEGPQTPLIKGEERKQLEDFDDQAEVQEGDPSPTLAGEPTDEEEWKECPDCAEMVRVRARKCRFCGYRFDEDKSTDDS